jgi:hypothetical protein
MAASTQQRADLGQSVRAELAARDAIALRAYELFEERGHEPGRDDQRTSRTNQSDRSEGRAADQPPIAHGASLMRFVAPGLPSRSASAP